MLELRAHQHRETTWVSAVSLDTSVVDLDDVSVVTGGSQISKTALLPKDKSLP